MEEADEEECLDGLKVVVGGEKVQILYIKPFLHQRNYGPALYWWTTLGPISGYCVEMEYNSPILNKYKGRGVDHL